MKCYYTSACETHVFFTFEIRDKDSFLAHVAAKEFHYIDDPVEEINHFITSFIGLSSPLSNNLKHGKSWRLSSEDLDVLFQVEDTFSIHSSRYNVDISNVRFAEQSWICVEPDYKYGVLAIGFIFGLSQMIEMELEKVAKLVGFLSEDNKWDLIISQGNDKRIVSYATITETIIDNTQYSNSFLLTFLEDRKHSTLAPSAFAINYVLATIYQGDHDFRSSIDSISFNTYKKLSTIDDCLILHENNRCVIIRKNGYHNSSGTIVLNTEVLLVIASLLEKTMVYVALYMNYDEGEGVTQRMHYLKLLTKISASPIPLSSKVYEICKDSLCFKDDIEALHTFIEFNSNNENKARHEREEKESRKLNLGITILTISQVLFALIQYLGIKDILGQPISQIWTYGSAIAVTLMLISFIIIVLRKK